MWGGPSQLETYDLKPEAPSEYRGPFRPIATNVPGMDICELFPQQARLADKFSLVRSLHHEMSSHNDGSIEVLTGKTPAKADPTSTAKSEHRGHDEPFQLTSLCREAFDTLVTSPKVVVFLQFHSRLLPADGIDKLQPLRIRTLSRARRADRPATVTVGLNSRA